MKLIAKIALAFIFLTSCAMAADAPSALTPVILDVRTQPEYDEGHLDGAQLIPHTEMAAQAGQVIPNKDTPIFLYCRRGVRAATAQTTLWNMGYTQVQNLGSLQAAAITLQLPIIK